MARYDLLLESYGYQDFCDTRKVDIDTYSDGSGTYTYDPDTQTFTAGGGTYGKSSISVPLYEGGSAYESYLDTINIIFNTDEVKDKNIRAFISSAVSLAKLDVTYSSDGNYTFQGNLRTVGQGSKSETSAFLNDEIRYRSSKPIVVSEIATASRNAYSVKFRVKAKLELEDDISIFYITILPTGLIFNGEFDA